MKLKSNLAPMCARKVKKKMNYRNAVNAIARKTQEIKKETRMPAVNNNPSLFGHRA